MEDKNIESESIQEIIELYKNYKKLNNKKRYQIELLVHELCIENKEKRI